MSSLPEPEKLDEPELKWGIKRGIGGKKKDVRFYESFTYDGVDYALYDCVFMYKAGQPAPYIAKLVKIWENALMERRIKVQWFFRPSEISKYLEGVEVQENELFFASGEGIGLSNINPLEAIAGKCNVVCTSTDHRNPQLSAEQIQMADYVFHRVFDVGSCTMSDQIDNKVGGLEVKYVFNKRCGDFTLDGNFDPNERKVVACNETPNHAGKLSTQQSNNVKPDTFNGGVLEEEEDKKQIPSLPNGRVLGKKSAGVDMGSCRNTAPIDVTIEKRSILVVGNGCNLNDDKVEFKDIESINEVQVEEGLKSTRKACYLKDIPSDAMVLSMKSEGTSGLQSVISPGNNSAQLLTGTAVSNNAKSELKHSDDCIKDVKFVGKSVSLDEKLSKMKKSPLSTEASKPGHAEGAVGLQTDSKLTKDFNASKGKLSKSNSFPSREKSESARAKDSGFTEKDKKLGKNVSACRDRPSTSISASCDEIPRSPTTNISLNDMLKTSSNKDLEGSRQALKLVQSSTTMERPLKRSADLTKEKPNVGREKSHENKEKKRAGNSCPTEERSHKKAKFDSASNQSEGGKDNTFKKPKDKICVGETKKLSKIVASFENKPKSKLGGVALKVSHNEDTKLSSDNTSNLLISRTKKGEKVGCEVIEVTRRPIEKSKWIKLSWEEKMKSAHDDGKLVLLQNLDPEYTSGEVEDIIWHVFQEMCTARMVQHTAISNPHSGQALVVFGSKDAAYRVLQKLVGGCLILPNQRPLVGCLGVFPKLSGKQTPFVGHLAIDKARHQMQRETVLSLSLSLLSYICILILILPFARFPTLPCSIFYCCCFCILSRKKLWLLLITPRITQLNMRWPWIGACCNPDLINGGKCYIRNNLRSYRNIRTISSRSEHYMIDPTRQ